MVKLQSIRITFHLIEKLYPAECDKTWYIVLNAAQEIKVKYSQDLSMKAFSHANEL
jgi:hypothetical protein